MTVGQKHPRGAYQLFQKSPPIRKQEDESWDGKKPLGTQSPF
jgi:hypothetical protein